MLTPEASFPLISQNAKKVVHQECTYFVSEVPENAGFSYLDSEGRNGSTIRLYPDQVRQIIHSLDQPENNGYERIFGHTSDMASVFRAMYQKLLDFASGK